MVQRSSTLVVTSDVLIDVAMTDLYEEGGVSLKFPLTPASC